MLETSAGIRLTDAWRERNSRHLASLFFPKLGTMIAHRDLCDLLTRETGDLRHYNILISKHCPVLLVLPNDG